MNFIINSLNKQVTNAFSHKTPFYDYDKASCLTRNHVTQGDGMNASVLSRSTSWSEVHTGSKDAMGERNKACTRGASHEHRVESVAGWKVYEAI